MTYNKGNQTIYKHKSALRLFWEGCQECFMTRRSTSTSIVADMQMITPLAQLDFSIFLVASKCTTACLVSR